ncbi:MAG: DUF4433 domain-containing protein [Candidatus Caenarcaniphilales bacterium]|nr:DUF4433 domain-containing protein [Candidatus Caenarcaniphilales bacterium]
MDYQNKKIYRITHYKNLQWILENGLWCSNSKTQDPNFIQIGNKVLISSRKDKPVKVHGSNVLKGTLSDYVPFYFCPRPPMLYNIITGYDVEKQIQSELIYIVSSLKSIRDENLEFVFSNGHAKEEISKFYDDLNSLNKIDWDVIRSNTWKNDPLRNIKS